MKSKVRACDGGFICLVCGKWLVAQMRRHMRQLHLSSNKDYFCPPRDKYFKNQMSIYSPVKSIFKDWQGVNYDSFAVKS